jgi:hypothetical protein
MRALGLRANQGGGVSTRRLEALLSELTATVRQARPQVIVVDSPERVYRVLASPRGARVQRENARKGGD